MMGSSVKLEVQWSPAHADHFITWGTDISLYEAGSLNSVSSKPSCLCFYSFRRFSFNTSHLNNLNGFLGITLSEKTGAHLVASNNNYHYIKCIDVCPDSKSEPLLAVGQANGKVVLTTFGPTSFDALGLNGKEFGMFFDHTIS